MKELKFCSTFGERLYYLGDYMDDNAPMISMNLIDEGFKKLSKEQKRIVAKKALEVAITEVNNQLGQEKYFVSN